MKTKALAYLNRDHLLHIDMIVSIQRGTAEILEVSSKGVLLWELKGETYMISADDLDTGSKMLESIEKGDLFTFHQEFMLDWGKEKYGLPAFFACTQAVYEGEAPLPLNTHIRIEPAQMAHLDAISSAYDGADRDYLEERIKDGELFGGFVDGNLCGFAGLHPEGSMGMLQVLDQYKNRGYGSDLAKYLVNYVKGLGLTPYGQVKKGNIPSYRMHKKLGFTLTDNYVYWLF